MLARIHGAKQETPLVYLYSPTLHVQPSKIIAFSRAL